MDIVTVYGARAAMNKFNFYNGKCTCGHQAAPNGLHSCPSCGAEAETTFSGLGKGRMMYSPDGPLVRPPRARIPKPEPEEQEVLSAPVKYILESLQSQGRPSFGEVYMQLAMIIAKRSTCARRRVGCVIVSSDFRRVLSVGYNGNAAGLPNCCDDSEASGACGCLHAEENATISCSESSTTPKIAFTTTYPCKMCAKRLIQLGGVKSVCYLEDYHNADAAKVFETVGITTERIVFESVSERGEL